MLVWVMKFNLDGCFAATILLYPAPTGRDARGEDHNAGKCDDARLGWLLRSNYSIVSGPHWTGC